MKFSFDVSFYIGWDFKHNSHMDERFGISIGKYYVGYYVGEGWCAGKLDANGCLIE